MDIYLVSTPETATQHRLLLFWARDVPFLTQQTGALSAEQVAALPLACSAPFDVAVAASLRISLRRGHYLRVNKAESLYAALTKLSVVPQETPEPSQTATVQQWQSAVTRYAQSPLGCDTTTDAITLTTSLREVTVPTSDIKALSASRTLANSAYVQVRIVTSVEVFVVGDVPVHVYSEFRDAWLAAGRMYKRKS